MIKVSGLLSDAERNQLAELATKLVKRILQIKERYKPHKQPPTKFNPLTMSNISRNYLFYGLV